MIESYALLEDKAGIKYLQLYRNGSRVHTIRLTENQIHGFEICDFKFTKIEMI
jgi:hypothetical protein